MTRTPRLIWSLCGLLLLPSVAAAQPIGTFSWQLQPYCNRVTVSVTQNGGIYTADGYDDQCGAPQRAPLVGLGTPNPDGTIGFGLHVVTVPGGRGVQIDARITLAALSGSWTDSAGNSGTFAFNANTGGNPRPAPPTGGNTIPATFSLLTDGGFLARGTVSVGNIPASGAGTRMMWYPKKAAFRAGEVTFPGWDDVNIGSHSTAFGFNNVAAGPYAFAAGVNSAAIGIAGVAAGSNAQANGNYSVAFGADTNAAGSFAFVSGRNNAAIGAYSSAFGQLSSATGNHSVVFGNSSVAAGSASLAGGTSAFANGSESVAMGLRVSAGGNGSVVLGSDAVAQAAASGTFIFADRSTTTDIVGFAPNEFIVRAAGGVGFYTNAATSTGVEMAANGSSWAPLSDVNAKENFRDVSGEEVLAKIARMSIQEWNYKAQDASLRHMGPTAQEFRAAFGLGDFPLRINTVDADGVALAAVKALEVRTRDLNDKLTRENDELRARLTRLEALLGKQ